MAMNRIHFQPGFSLPAFIQQFGTEAQCEAGLEKARWPQGFRCPRCDQADHYVLHVGAHKTFQCQTCRLPTSLIVGTRKPKNLPEFSWINTVLGDIKTQD